MTTPAAYLVTATAAVHRPVAQSLAAATTGKRAISMSAFASLRESSSDPTKTTTTSSTGSNSLQSHTSSFRNLENRRHYSTMPSSRRISIPGSGNSSNNNYNNSIIINNNKNSTTSNKTRRFSQQLIATRPFSSSSKRDFYEVLGVGKGADKAEIKKSYFKLAKQYHPDTNQVRAGKHGDFLCAYALRHHLVPCRVSLTFSKFAFHKTLKSAIRTIKTQLKNSRRLQKPTKSYQTTNSDNSTTPTATRVSIPTLGADRVGAIHSKASRALAEGMARSTSPPRAKQSIPRNYSRPSSAWVVETVDDVTATVVLGRVPTCKCTSA